MEDVGAIHVDVDALNLLAVEIAAHMGALVDDKASLAAPVGKVGKRAAEEAGADNEEIVLGQM